MSHNIIESISFFRYSLPFKTPLTIAEKTLTIRKGFLISVELKSRMSGIGEIAPLPGRSKETLKDVLVLLPELEDRLKGESVARLLLPIDSDDHPLFDFPSSVIFGVQMALLNIPNANSKSPLFHTQGFDVTINGLLNINRAYNPDLETQIISSHRWLKAKIELSKDGHELHYLNKVQQKIRVDTRLILDGNLSWNFDTATTKIKELSALPIEYLEEPFKSLDDSEAFYKLSGIPFALDEHWESNKESAFEKLKNGELTGVKYVVIKPTICGGIVAAIEDARRLADLNIKVIISSCFESGLGILSLASLSHHLYPEGFAGLDTIKLFKNDLLNPPLHLKSDLITMYPSLFQPSQLVESLCKPIDIKQLQEQLSRIL